MALAGRLPPLHARKPCLVSQIYKVLPPEEQEALMSMMGNRAWSHVAIVKALSEEGHAVGNLDACRRQECLHCPNWGYHE